MADAVKLIDLVFRGLDLLWTVLTVALVGNMIDDYPATNPHIVNYSMFVPAFALLTLFYLIPATVMKSWPGRRSATVMESWSGHPIVMLTIDLLNTLFFLVGAIAFPSYLHGHSCSNWHYTLHNPITFTDGASNREKRCREAQAICAFLWFGFAAFAGSTILSGLQIRDRSNANVQSGSICITGPDVLQVEGDGGYRSDIRSLSSLNNAHFPID